MAEIINKKAEKKYRAAKVFNDHAAEYESWFTDSLIYETELSALQDLPLKMNKPKLEIGVGPGYFARDLGVTFGLDPAWKPLQFAAEKGIRCFLGFGEELPLQNRSVGAIYLLFTLCFAMDPDKIIRECRRSLIDGGYLIVGMVPAESHWGKYLSAKKTAGHTFYKEANFYTIKTVCTWLSDAGFNIVESRSTLYQSPDQVEQREKPRADLDEAAGFVVIAARKENG